MKHSQFFICYDHITPARKGFVFKMSMSEKKKMEKKFLLIRSPKSPIPLFADLTHFKTHKWSCSKVGYFPVIAK